MCLYPTQRKNRKYVANKKNGGIVPQPYDRRAYLIETDCGNCIQCRKAKARDWQVRLLEEIKHDNTGKFVTLTLSDQSIYEITKQLDPKLNGYLLDNKIATYAVRHWLERHRRKHKESIKHWLVTELGHEGTENIHLHGIIWTKLHLDIIEQKWKYGWIWKGKEIKDQIINYVNEQTVGYITKYVNKIDQDHPNYKPIILTTPGIGKKYLENIWQINKYNEKETILYYKTRTGHKIALPKYYKRKLYTDEQREKLWMQQLNKQTHYIMGEAISTKNHQEYGKALEYFRQLNKELKFGDNIQDQEKQEYERQRRIEMQKIRIAKGKNCNPRNNK